MKQKDDLLKESKAKTATMDNIKSQIELLIKVRHGATRPYYGILIISFQTATEVQKKVDDLVPVQNQSTSAEN